VRHSGRMVHILAMYNFSFIENKSDLKKEIQPGFTLAITERRDPAMNLISRFESGHVWECAIADDFLSLEKKIHVTVGYLQGRFKNG
jgi:hypothetical protein